MNDLILLPDTERLTVDFLLDQTEVTAFFAADLPHDRIYTTLPERKVWPALRITLFDDQPVTRTPEWLDRQYLQIDAWGGPRKTARDLAATARAALLQRMIGVHELGVVTAVDCSGLRELPDSTFTPAKPRFLFTASIAVHPNLAPGS